MSQNKHRARRNLRGSVITVSKLQQRHVLVLAIPEGFKPKRTMDYVAPLAEAPASSAMRALPSCVLV